MKNRKLFNLVCVASLAIIMAFGAATAVAYPITGGWSEEGGYFYESSQAQQGGSSVSLLSTPQHTGKADTKVIDGTTNKRSHGWTTWVGVRHYTLARLEHNGLFCSGIIASKRNTGVGGTEAKTVWKPFNPNACCDGFGGARTYYGRA